MNFVTERNFDTVFPLSAREEFWRRVETALETVFHVPSDIAKEYRKRVDRAPIFEQMLVYHDEPLKVAGDLLGKEIISDAELDIYRMLVGSTGTVQARTASATEAKTLEPGAPEFVTRRNNLAQPKQGHADFFISRAGTDAPFAIWVGKLIAAQGKTYILQDEHFGHSHFMGAMDAALKSGARVVGLLSLDYLKSDYCLKEATAALSGDPLNKKQRLILLRLEPCASGGVLSNLAYTSLLDERRQPDPAPLQLKILRALGFENPKLEGLPPPPDGTLSERGQVLHPEVRPVPGFTGREEELGAVDAALWTKGGTAALTAASAAVKGLGGVGKSVLAQEYAWRNRARYHGVWWIRAEKGETLLDDLVELGARFIPGLKDEPDRTKAAQAALDQIAHMKAERPWLLVYDNVEQPGGIEKLTPVEGAHVLITTRWSDWGKAAAPVKIGVFPPDVAAQFLLDSTERTDRAGAEKLAAALGCLPLALDHAAAYCRRTGIGFETYRALAAGLIRKVPKGADYEDEKPVFATFELAIQKATQACPEAEKLMGICAFLAPERIPVDIVTADVMSEIERGDAVAALQEVSLVTLETLNDGSPGISVHRLVQEVMRGRLGEGASEMAALATRLVANAFPFDSDYPEHWPTCRRLESHAIAVLVSAPGDGKAAQKTTLLLSQYALHLKARADYIPAEPLMRRALSIEEKHFGPEHPNVAGCLNNLANLLQATNRLAEAEPLMRRALEIDEASFGPDHPNVGRDLNNLGSLLRATKRLAEAEPLMRRALEIDETSFGPDHPDVAIDLNNLAGLLRATKRLAEAEPLYRRALKIDETSFGPDHPDVAIDLNNLARLLRDTNRLGEAQPLLRRALSILEACLGPEHPSTRTVRGNLAALEAELRRETGTAPVSPDGPASIALPEPPPEAAKPGLLRRLFGGGS